MIMPPDRNLRSQTDEVCDFFRTIETAFHDVDRKLQSGFANQEDYRRSIALMEQIRQNVLRLRNIIPENECTSLLDTLDNILAGLQTHGYASVGVQTQSDNAGIRRVQGLRGAPTFDIERDQLQHLLRLGYTVTDIAKKGLLGVSMHRNTIYKHMRKNGLQSSKQMYGAADEDIREIINSYITHHRNAGYEEIRAYLTTRDPPIHVARDRVRAVVSELDPEGVAVRWRSVVQRRKYAVEGPNSLWHIDGHHKLIRYKIYIHGGIDGYSRLIPYLRASCFNTSRVAFNAFVSGVMRSCIPSRVRMDDGVENGLIRRFMEVANGDDRGSSIQGKSVHNQRIERLWRDVHCKVVTIFVTLLQALEESGALDIENSIQLFCAQFVFLPALNLALDEWRVTHNHHKIRTEGHKTPEQLWLTGIVEQRERDTTAVRNVITERDCQPICQQVLPEFDMQDVKCEEKFNLPRLTEEVSDNIVESLVQEFGMHGVKIDNCIDMYGEVLTYVSEAIASSATE